MDQLFQFLINIMSQPFFIGLFIGLILALVVALQGWIRRRALTKEHQIFREYLNTHVEVHTKGSQELMSEIENLKKQNENLRISLGSLRNKPGRDELRTLLMYDKAIRLMNQRAPGFAPVWEAVLKEVEVEMHQIDTGVIAWIRRIIRSSLANKIQPSTESIDNSKQTVEVLKM